MGLSPEQTHRLNLLNALTRNEVCHLYERTLHDDFSVLVQIIRDGHPGYSNLETETLEELVQKKGLSVPSV